MAGRIKVSVHEVLVNKGLIILGGGFLPRPFLNASQSHFPHQFGN